MNVRMMTTLLLAATVLAGCSSLRGGKEPDRIYVLRTAAAPSAAPVAGVLSVLRPTVQPGLDTDRIALTRPGNELDYFAASRWSDSLPRVLGALAVQSFGSGGGFTTAVDAGRTSVVADYELLLAVRHFEAVYDASGGNPVVRVAFECVLAASGVRRVLGRCDADEREPADNRMSSIVAALERATQRALDSARSQAMAAAANGELRR